MRSRAISALLRASGGINAPKRVVRLGKVSPLLPVPSHIPKPHYAWNQSFAPHEKMTPELGLLDENIERKSPEMVAKMRAACKLAQETLKFAGKLAQPGVSTDNIDKAVHNFIVEHGAYPSTLGYFGFPKATCTSVNEVLCHGIPDDQVLQDGDIINIDITVFKDGVHGDCSATFFVGTPSDRARALVETTKASLIAGIKVCGPGIEFSRIGKAIQAIADKHGYKIPEFMTGHGIGTYFHCPPLIWHVDNQYEGRMQPGMTFTIEPLFVENSAEFDILSDGWTALSSTRDWSAQFEHTILVTSSGVEVLTDDPDDPVKM